MWQRGCGSGWTRARCQDSGVDPEREQLWAELFAQLDLNKDGRIDVNELRVGLAARGMSWSSVEEVRSKPNACNHNGRVLIVHDNGP